MASKTQTIATGLISESLVSVLNTSSLLSSLSFVSVFLACSPGFRPARENDGVFVCLGHNIKQEIDRTRYTCINHLTLDFTDANRLQQLHCKFTSKSCPVHPEYTGALVLHALVLDQ